MVKGLIANRSGEWRYRGGNYRILAHIYDEGIVIEKYQRAVLFSE